MYDNCTTLIDSYPTDPRRSHLLALHPALRLGEGLELYKKVSRGPDGDRKKITKYSNPSTTRFHSHKQSGNDGIRLGRRVILAAEPFREVGSQTMKHADHGTLRRNVHQCGSVIEYILRFKYAGIYVRTYIDSVKRTVYGSVFIEQERGGEYDDRKLILSMHQHPGFNISASIINNCQYYPQNRNSGRSLSRDLQA